nr:MAG TPA: hypothetical protein [Caudoviricetes sp.]
MLRILDKNKAPVKGLRVYKDLCIERVLELDDKTHASYPGQEQSPCKRLTGI